MAHGQMNAKPLEAVMLKFFRREADVLIASAIIQSGIDVPSANTIIVNRADTFGLAQLYQLRGRVGRSGEQAYAYFLVPDEGQLSGDAQKRLIAIQQFTDSAIGLPDRRRRHGNQRGGQSTRKAAVGAYRGDRPRPVHADGGAGRAALERAGRGGGAGSRAAS